MGLVLPADLVPPPVPERPRQSLWRRFRALCGGTPEGPLVRAVWVPPGAQLILKNMPGDFQQRYGIEDEEGAVVVEISVDHNMYQDAVRFYNGTVLPLQSLREGIRVEVLSLAGALVVEDRRFPVPAR